MKKNYFRLLTAILLSISTLISPRVVGATPTQATEVQWLLSDGPVVADKSVKPNEQAPQQAQQLAQHPTVQKKSKSKTIWIVLGVGVALALLRILAAS